MLDGSITHVCTVSHMLNKHCTCCRLCFAGSMGTPSTSQLLSEVKATAAAVGAIGVLIDLLR
jgi:hypothetical protein